MNQNHRSNVALALVLTTPIASDFDLDECIRRGFEGDAKAMHDVARELHPRLVHEARQHLGDLDHEADDVVQDLFVAALEGRIRPPRGRGEGVAHLLRLTAVFARKHARQVRRFRDLE